MSHQSSLLFEDMFEETRSELQRYSGSIDQLQTIGEGEIDQKQVPELGRLLKTIASQQSQIKESILQLEKVQNSIRRYSQSSKGVDQRTKTRKLRDRYQAEFTRYDKLNKEIQQDCSQEVKDLIKGVVIRKENVSSRQNSASKASPSTQQESNKLSTNSDHSSGNMPQAQELQSVQYDHLDITNQIIRERQEDLDSIQMRTNLLNQIAKDLSLEVDRQDEMIVAVDKNFTKTQENVKGASDQITQAQTSQKSATKKYICLFLCALISLGILLMIILI